VQQHARDARLPGLDEVIDRVLDATWRQPAGANIEGELQRVVNYAALGALFWLGANDNAGPQVQAIATQELAALKGTLGERMKTETVLGQRAHLAHGQRLIERFMDKPKDFAPPPVPTVPPGQPIGSGAAAMQCDFDFDPLERK
jgi:hypothetical protein